jgi:hypothetical protein
MHASGQPLGSAGIIATQQQDGCSGGSGSSGTGQIQGQGSLQAVATNVLHHQQLQLSGVGSANQQHLGLGGGFGPGGLNTQIRNQTISPTAVINCFND